MTPRQVRIELVGQHADLRQIIEAVREVARRAQEGESLHQQLQASTLRLAEALSAHNHREEELLRTIAMRDGWAQADTETMNQRHFDEHRALYAALVEVSVNPNVRWVSGHLVAALDTIVEHMAHEERTFLDEGVLSDDEPDTEPQGNPAPRAWGG